MWWWRWTAVCLIIHRSCYAFHLQMPSSGLLLWSYGILLFFVSGYGIAYYALVLLSRSSWFNLLVWSLDLCLLLYAGSLDPTTIHTYTLVRLLSSHTIKGLVFCSFKSSDDFKPRTSTENPPKTYPFRLCVFCNRSLTSINHTYNPNSGCWRKHHKLDTTRARYNRVPTHPPSCRAKVWCSSGFYVRMVEMGDYG